MAPVAIVLLILGETGSESLAGVCVAALLLPSVLTGPAIGAALDRSARPVRLLALDQALGLSALAALAALAGGAPDWTLPLLLVPAGLSLPLSTGGFTAMVPRLATASLLPRANALEAASFNAAVLAGPALAGAVALAASPRASVALQAGLKGAALLLVLTLAGGALARPAAATVHRIRDGLRHVGRSAPLLGVTFAGALSMGGRGLLTVAFPLYAVERLGESAGFAGWLWAAFAAGSIAGALGSVRLRLPVAEAAVVLVSIALSGLLMLLWPLAEAPAAALCLVALAGVAYGPGFAATFGVRQRWTPRELHGQVFSTAASLKTASFALGSAAAGAATAGLGVEGALLLAGGLHLAAAAGGAALVGVSRPAAEARRSPAAQHRRPP